MKKEKTYSWGNNNPYNDFSSYFKKKFDTRIQKIAVDAGFTCPNRDGSKGRGGCTYCNNNTFNPFYCSPKKTISQQLKEGIAFFAEKYKTQKYLAYFQAYSNTYADLQTLKNYYAEALKVEGVTGLVVATRPDCVNEEILDYLQKLAETYYIILEFGIETCNEETLKKINRGHTFAQAVSALELSEKRGLHVGVHYVLGLPGDSREENLSHAKIISNLPFETLKLHQLQIIKGTKMAKQFKETPEMFNLFSAEEYIDFVVQFAERLKPEIIIERFISESPADLLIAPKWGGLKNFEIVEKIKKQFIKQNTRQGKLY
ncbi:MAG: TIGR01212 family radical SAM protein [Bacteroidales bacterium]|nr:TIGR01212 family radical SAM protein [Bacteroidales bacterium]